MLATAFPSTFVFRTNAATSGQRMGSGGTTAGMLALYDTAVHPWAPPIGSGTNFLVLHESDVNDIGNLTTNTMMSNHDAYHAKIAADGGYDFSWTVPIVTNYSAAQLIDRDTMNQYLRIQTNVAFPYDIAAKFTYPNPLIQADNVHLTVTGYRLVAYDVFGIITSPAFSKTYSQTLDMSVRNFISQGANSSVSINNGTVVITENSSSGRNPTLLISQDSIRHLHRRRLRPDQRQRHH
jgi:hypothetical protein